MRIGIYGYGNLGKGVEKAILSSSDASVVGIFTRRAEKGVASPFGNAVYGTEKAESFKNKIDVMIICGGSASDLPKMTPSLAKIFNVVDSFDNHSKAVEHFSAVDKAARECGKVAMISAGWDPGIFSLSRLYFSAFLPSGITYTLWGPGVSQGHSEALRRIEGVVDARQYTIPKPSIKSKLLSEGSKSFAPSEIHRRECYVAVKDGADKEKIRNEITGMEGYFKGYDVDITFVSESELKERHSKMNHSGSVIRVKNNGTEDDASLELSLKMDSNPDFTASVLLASARAVFRLSFQEVVGCVTVADIPPVYFSEFGRDEFLKKFI